MSAWGLPHLLLLQDRVHLWWLSGCPGKMCETLNLKFMAEVGTNRGLLPEHFSSWPRRSSVTAA